MTYNWVSLLGKFEKDQEGTITFEGGYFSYKDDKNEDHTAAKIGSYLSDQRFSEGKISMDVEFTEIDEDSACQIIFAYDPMQGGMANAGIIGGKNDSFAFAIRYYEGKKWENVELIGSRENLVAQKKYHIVVKVRGSLLTLAIDNVEVCKRTLLAKFPISQVGIWCQSSSNIKISEFDVEAIKPQVFVIMQFSSPYNELYRDVIKPVCEQEFGLDAVRADERFGPSLIIEDVARDIKESQIIIAEITPVNANVYYEVGYAHALNKATILIAEKNTPLPFDVSPFRTLFYENSIAGKDLIEQGLRRYLDAIIHAPSSIRGNW